MSIRRYEVTAPATTAELRQVIGAAIGAGAANTTIELGIREIDVDIPQADAPSRVEFRMQGMRTPSDRETAVIGEVNDGESSVHLSLPLEGETPATLTIASD